MIFGWFVRKNVTLKSYNRGHPHIYRSFPETAFFLQAKNSKKAYPSSTSTSSNDGIRSNWRTFEKE